MTASPFPMNMGPSGLIAPWWPQSRERHSIGGLTWAWAQEQLGRNSIAYYNDLMDWLLFCRDQELHPARARPTDVREWRGTLPHLQPATIARRMAAVSSWYQYLLANGADGFTYNPLTATRRPVVARDESTTLALTVEQVADILGVAASHGPRRLRNHALLTLLATAGLRVGEALSLTRGSRRSSAGYSVITYTAKRGKIRTRPLDGSVVQAIDAYLDDRDARRGGALVDLDEPLFATERPNRSEHRITLNRMDQPSVFRLVRTCAQTAGIRDWRDVNPHTLRHFYATRSLELGVPLTQVQDDMGHADPRTTRGYDRARRRLAADGALVVGRDLALHVH